MIQTGHRNNFTVLQRAFAQGDVALLECRSKETGRPVIVICAVQSDGDEVEFVPFAKLFEANPYEELIPPLEEERGHD